MWLLLFNFLLTVFLFIQVCYMPFVSKVVVPINLYLPCTCVGAPPNPFVSFRTCCRLSGYCEDKSLFIFSLHFPCGIIFCPSMIYLLYVASCVPEFFPSIFHLILNLNFSFYAVTNISGIFCSIG